MSESLTRRGSAGHVVRRVPVEFAALDKRGIVRHSTRIKVAQDRTGRRAARLAGTLNEKLEGVWRGVAKGQMGGDLTRYDDLRRRARSLGFGHVPDGEPITRSQDKCLDRSEVLLTKGLRGDPATRDPVPGTAPKPSPRLSPLLAGDEAATRDETRDMSADQRRIWRSSRRRAMLQYDVTRPRSSGRPAQLAQTRGAAALRRRR